MTNLWLVKEVVTDEATYSVGILLAVATSETKARQFKESMESEYKELFIEEVNVSRDIQSEVYLVKVIVSDNCTYSMDETLAIATDEIEANEIRERLQPSFLGKLFTETAQVNVRLDQ